MNSHGNEFIEHLQELLAVHVGPIRVRRMFGGWGIYQDELMFALVADDTLYLKTDSESRPLFAARALTPFVYQHQGQATEMSYWRAPDEALEDPDVAAVWARHAIAAATRARAAKPLRRKPAARQ